MVFNEVFLRKDVITNSKLSENGVLAYVALKSIMDDSKSMSNQTRCLEYVTVRGMAYMLMGSQDYDKVLLKSLNEGINELVNAEIISIEKDFGGKILHEYSLDMSNLYFDGKKSPYIIFHSEDLTKILSCESEDMKKKIKLLRYFIIVCGTFDGSKGMKNVDNNNLQCKIGHMPQSYIAEEARISVDTCQRYNSILEEMKVLYVRKSNDKIRIYDKLKQITNTYSRYKDMELCDFWSYKMEEEYGVLHQIHVTKKNKEQADHNRRLAQIYNRLCAGYEYEKELVKEVYRYIKNKNNELQKQIDKKNDQERLTYSDERWVAYLESQKRSEDVFEKFDYLKSVEIDQWGEEDKMDNYTVEELFEMPIHSDVVDEEEENDIEEETRHDYDSNDLIDIEAVLSGKWNNSKELSINNPFRQ